MNRIQEVLEEKGISQTALAKELGINRQRINRLCLNKDQPSMNTLFKIAQILDVKAAELVGDNSDLE